MLNFLFPHSDIEIYLNKIINVSPEDVPQILKENHDSTLAGHPGYHRTVSRIQNNYYWPNMHKNIREYIKNCESCQKYKIDRKPTKLPLEITSTSSQPFERISLDIVGPLPLTEEGNRFILTFQDDLTKFLFAISLPDHTAETVSEGFIKFISIFGTPISILTDQGSEFMSSLFADLNKTLKIKHLQTTPYRPQTNGSLERSHSVIKEYLRHYVAENQSLWDKFLPTCILAYNSSTHSSTSYTPYELLFGSKMPLPSSLKDKVQFRYNYDDYVDNLKLRLQNSFRIAKETLIKSKENSAKYYNTKLKVPNFQIGDLVLLRNDQAKLGQTKKLSPIYTGPHKSINLTNTNAILKIGNKTVTVHLNKIKPFSG